jgi:mono/diheme cytochrome c family protein
VNRRLVCKSVAAVLSVLLLAGCQSRTAPPITESFLRAGIRQNANARTLTEGRRVFLNRCIQCHALPKVAKYDPPRLKAILAIMSGRASLSPKQHDAVVKYLLTVRSQ